MPTGRHAERVRKKGKEGLKKSVTNATFVREEGQGVLEEEGRVW